VNILYRFTVLDSFRGIAAILVFFYHLQHIIDSIILSNAFIKGCYLFVDFFFIISGFVITHNYRKKINSAASFKLFIKKRFFRLYPLHFILLMIFLVYYLLRITIDYYFDTANDFTFIGFLSNLFLMNALQWHPQITSLTWNMPSWSISAEVISYILFGITCLIPNERLQKILLFFLLVVSYKILYELNHNFSITATHNFGFLRGIFGFFLGFFVYHFYLKSFKSSIYTKLSMTIAEVILITGCITLLCFQGTSQSFGFIYYIIFSLIVYVFSLEKGCVSKAISKIESLKVLGKISYSIYINHYLLLIFFSILYKNFGLALINNVFLDLLVIVIQTIALIYISKLSYQFIELKFNNGLRLNGLFNKKFIETDAKHEAKNTLPLLQNEVQ